MTKTQPAVVSILVLVLVVTFIVGLGIYRMCLPNYRNGDYSQIALDYKDAEDKLAQAFA